MALISRKKVIALSVLLGFSVTCNIISRLFYSSQGFPKKQKLSISAEPSCSGIDFKVAANYSTESYCQNETCQAYFFPTVEENAHYLMKHLRKKTITRTFRRFLSGDRYHSGGRSPETVLVNVHSSDHYAEFRKMLDINNKTFGSTYTLVVYDLGLTKMQAQFIKQCGICEYRQFPFDDFPAHVKNLMTYAFKPLITHIMLQEYQYVVWMDTSIRFKTANVSDLLNHAKEHHIAVMADYYFQTCLTHPEMFAFFHEDICLYCGAIQIRGGFFVMYSSNFTRNVLSYAWSLCALDKDCMNPPDTRINVASCRLNKSPHFCYCSRFDQSALTLLLYRLFAKARILPSIVSTYTHDPVMEPWLYVKMLSVLSVERRDEMQGV